MSASEKLFDEYKIYADQDRSIYKHLSLAVYYAYLGETKKSLAYLKQFSEEKGVNYLTIRLLEIDPLIDSLKNSPLYLEILEGIKFKFWEEHKTTRDQLEQKGLIWPAFLCSFRALKKLGLYSHKEACQHVIR